MFQTNENIVSNLLNATRSSKECADIKRSRYTASTCKQTDVFQTHGAVDDHLGQRQDVLAGRLDAVRSRFAEGTVDLRGHMTAVTQLVEQHQSGFTRETFIGVHKPDTGTSHVDVTRVVMKYSSFLNTRVRAAVESEDPSFVLLIDSTGHPIMATETMERCQRRSQGDR
jgi:hypothetical protein